jgi:hypothetical protein
MKVVCVDSGIIGFIFFSSRLMDSSNSEISTALCITYYRFISILGRL